MRKSFAFQHTNHRLDAKKRAASCSSSFLLIFLFLCHLLKRIHESRCLPVARNKVTPESYKFADKILVLLGKIIKCPCSKSYSIIGTVVFIQSVAFLLKLLCELTYIDILNLCHRLFLYLLKSVPQAYASSYH